MGARCCDYTTSDCGVAALYSRTRVGKAFVGVRVTDRVQDQEAALPGEAPRSQPRAARMVVQVEPGDGEVDVDKWLDRYAAYVVSKLPHSEESAA